mmetsp:Transcript_49396/g.141325  ORF Transcript_49396/g.141325 Transcript_49396/m.141325 type:complete len:213 (-) Transcript_49396:267-905(-)
MSVRIRTPPGSPLDSVCSTRTREATAERVDSRGALLMRRYTLGIAHPCSTCCGASAWRSNRATNINPTSTHPWQVGKCNTIVTPQLDSIDGATGGAAAARTGSGVLIGDLSAGPHANSADKSASEEPVMDGVSSSLGAARGLRGDRDRTAGPCLRGRGKDRESSTPRTPTTSGPPATRTPRDASCSAMPCVQGPASQGALPRTPSKPLASCT